MYHETNPLKGLLFFPFVLSLKITVGPPHLMLPETVCPEADGFALAKGENNPVSSSLEGSCASGLMS